MSVACTQDPRDIIELFSLRMPGFFEATLENPKLLRVVSTLFGGHTAGRPFAQVPAAAWWQSAGCSTAALSAGGVEAAKEGL